jgi:aryl-alcohol dehydrogenase-like predicted oxidoreductase
VCGQRLSQIVWSPLAQGVLTGKYRPGQTPPPDSRAANSDMNVAMDRLLDDAVLEAVDRLRPVAAEAGLSMAELALAWMLRRPELASAIVGASRPEQVHANANSSSANGWNTSSRSGRGSGPTSWSRSRPGETALTRRGASSRASGGTVAS